MLSSASGSRAGGHATVSTGDGFGSGHGTTGEGLVDGPAHAVANTAIPKNGTLHHLAADDRLAGQILRPHLLDGMRCLLLPLPEFRLAGGDGRL